jgi:hypothetical protein
VCIIFKKALPLKTTTGWDLVNPAVDKLVCIADHNFLWRVLSWTQMSFLLNYNIWNPSVSKSDIVSWFTTTSYRETVDIYSPCNLPEHPLTLNNKAQVKIPPCWKALSAMQAPCSFLSRQWHYSVDFSFWEEDS